MNPDVIKAARALVKAQQKYPDMTNDEADHLARAHGVELQSVVDYVNKLRADRGNLVASGLEGFTANFGDEMVGLLPKALGGGESGKEEMRLRQELAHLDHPVAAPAAEIAGGLASAVIGTGLVPEVAGSARVANALVTGAEAGGVYGGVAGAGAGETAQERLSGGASGAFTGMIAGGALGAGGAALMELTPAAAVLRKHLKAIEESGGMQALRTKLDEFAGANAGRSSLITAADLSPYMGRNLREAAKRDLQTNVNAKDILTRRQSSIDERMITDIENKSVGLPDAEKLAKALKDEKFEWSNTAYDKLRDLKVEFTPEDINKFVDTPTVAHALQLAKLADDMSTGGPLQQLMERVQMGSRSPADMKALEQAVNKQKINAPARPITFNDLQALQRTLDGKAGKAFADRNVPLGRAYKEVRQQVLDAIENKVPEFKAVQAEFAAKSRLQNMVQQGMDTWGAKGTRELARDISMLPEKDAEIFRYSMASKLVDQIRDNPSATIRKLWYPSQSMKEKLRTIFGDNFDHYMNQLGVERDMGATLEAISNVPPGEPPNPVGSIAHSMIYGPKYAAFNVVGKLFGHPHAKRVSSQMGTDLLTQGSHNVERLLQRLEEPVSLFHSRRAGALGGRAAPYVNSLFGGNR